VIDEMRMEPLGGDHARKSERPRESREVHRRHAACSDLVEDRIATHLLLRGLLRRRLNHRPSSERKAPIFKGNRASHACRTNVKSARACPTCAAHVRSCDPEPAPRAAKWGMMRAMVTFARSFAVAAPLLLGCQASCRSASQGSASSTG